MVVIHYTAMDCPEAACRALSDPAREVSAHYLIAPDGGVMALVDEAERAWHAGTGRWGDVADVNSHSVGIELSNDGFSPFSAALMDALEELLARIMARWDVSACRVIAHSDMAPGRKIDPGARFDWQRLARSGLAVWPKRGEAECAGFLRDARTYGYTADVDEATLLAAFRLRFRFGYDGPLDRVDAGMAADLATRFPFQGRGGA